MTKGLFTSLEEIRFQYAFVNGHVAPDKASSMTQREIRQDNRRIAQNVKRLNRMTNQARSIYVR